MNNAFEKALNNWCLETTISNKYQKISVNTCAKITKSTSKDTCDIQYSYQKKSF